MIKEVWTYCLGGVDYQEVWTNGLMIKEVWTVD